MCSELFHHVLGYLPLSILGCGIYLTSELTVLVKNLEDLKPSLTKSHLPRQFHKLLTTTADQQEGIL